MIVVLVSGLIALLLLLELQDIKEREDMRVRVTRAVMLRRGIGIFRVVEEGRSGWVTTWTRNGGRR